MLHNSKSHLHYRWILIVAILFILLNLYISYDRMKAEKIFKEAINNEIQKVTVQKDSLNIQLTRSEMDYFFKELKSKRVFPHHSHTLDTYEVTIQFTYTTGEIYSFEVLPDSDYSGEYWIDIGPVFFQKRLQWLENFFKENGFFNHKDILER